MRGSHWARRLLRPTLQLLSLIAAVAEASVAVSAQTHADRGDLLVVWPTESDPDLAEWQQSLKESGVLESIAGGINESLALPYNLLISFAKCNEANAYYRSESREISICYELIEAFTSDFEDVYETEEDVEAAVTGATVHTIYHELGHALIDLLDLPTTGKEDDAADELAAYILTDGSDDGEGSALAGAESFLLAAEKAGSKISDAAFADEHSLDKQRFYNTVCLVYGSNPGKYAHLVDDETLPRGRAASCEFEYRRMNRTWEALLHPYVKP